MLIEMTIKGLMVDPITNMPIVILKDKVGERVLPIWVGIFEANAIALQMENIATPRPMTHDLLRNVITDLEGSVDRVVVSDLKDNTFYAIIHLTVRGERVVIDARPSDAIALALRTRSPILVEETSSTTRRRWTSRRSGPTATSCRSGSRVSIPRSSASTRCEWLVVRDATNHQPVHCRPADIPWVPGFSPAAGSRGAQASACAIP